MGTEKGPEWDPAKPEDEHGVRYTRAIRVRRLTEAYRLPPPAVGRPGDYLARDASGREWIIPASALDLAEGEWVWLDYDRPGFWDKEMSFHQAEGILLSRIRQAVMGMPWDAVPENQRRRLLLDIDFLFRKYWDEAPNFYSVIGQFQSRLITADAEMYRQREAKDAAYTERNRLVALLAALFPSSLEEVPFGPKQLPVLTWWIIIELPTGSVAWQVAPDDLTLFAHVPRHQGRTWDGDTTEEKYQRIAALIADWNSAGVVSKRLRPIVDHRYKSPWFWWWRQDPEHRIEPFCEICGQPEDRHQLRCAPDEGNIDTPSEDMDAADLLMVLLLEDEPIMHETWILLSDALEVQSQALAKRLRWTVDQDRNAVHLWLEREDAPRGADRQEMR